MTKAYYSMELDKITGAQENDGERGTFCFISHISYGNTEASWWFISSYCLYLWSGSFSHQKSEWDRLGPGTLCWDLGPFAEVLQCLHLDTPLLQKQNTKKLYGTKNNCVHAQLGQILDPKDTKRPKKTQLPLFFFFFFQTSLLKYNCLTIVC